MIADWQTDCVYLAALLPRRHPGLWRGLEQTLRAHRVEFHLLPGCKDVWVRDFLPVQVGEGRFLKFRYAPDYLRAGYQDRITGPAVCRPLLHLGACETSPILLDGGNVVASPDRVILTDKVFVENPQSRPRELRRTLARLLGVEEVITVPCEPGDPFGHADSMVRFIDPRTVLVNDYTAVDRAHGRKLRAVLKRHRLGCEEVPYFVEDRLVEGIPSAVGNYVNYLRVGTSVVVPSYGVPQDEAALRKLEGLFPGARVVPQRCRSLAAHGGALHCVTWTARSPSREGVPGKGRV